jgi:hypothetical protein
MIWKVSGLVRLPAARASCQTYIEQTHQQRSPVLALRGLSSFVSVDSPLRGLAAFGRQSSLCEARLALRDSSPLPLQYYYCIIVIIINSIIIVF